MGTVPRTRVVAITGASSGVGRAAARAFAERGDHVALMARSDDALKEATREIEATGGRATFVPLDVADAAAVEAAADDIERDLGPIDVWVNSAMVSVYSPIWELGAEEIARVTDVNYLGSVHGTLAALKRMRMRKSGTIVQVGSGLAYRSIPLQAPYCASKFAIRAFTESLRVELMHDRSNIKITMVELPGLNTPHFTRVRARLPRAPRPVSPVYTPEVAARAIVHAADNPSRREYVVGGLTTAMIAAQKLAPGLVDRYLARTGWSSQMTGEPLGYREGNLLATLPGDPGASGPFGDEAHDRSVQWFIARHRRRAAAAATAAALMAVVRARRG